MKKPGARAGLRGSMGLREGVASAVGVIVTVAGIAVTHAALLEVFEGNTILIFVVAGMLITGVIAAVSIDRR